MSDAKVEITWLGHNTFLIKTPEGKTLLVDPWLSGNPSCPKEFYEVESDAILVTHGHGDHIGDLFEAQRRCSGPVVGIAELATWMGIKGVAEDRVIGMNKGGHVTLDDLKVEIAMTNAHHSSSFTDGDQIIYLGEPAGLVVSFSNGQRIYVAGDTCVFSDMALIRRLERPDIAILPIGDLFTMDPRAAAVACEFLEVEAVIPSHYGTFGALTGTPAKLKEELAALKLDTKVLELEIGVTRAL